VNKKNDLRFRLLSNLLIMPLFFVAQNTVANEKFGSPNPEFIIRSCQEVVEIYKARDEKRFMASQRTSLAEAMRAGYCLGLLAMTSCKRGYYKKDWMIAAKRIGELSPDLDANQNAKSIDILGHGACAQ